MSALGNALRDQYDGELMRRLGRIVEEAIFPFAPGRIEAYISESLSTWPAITVTVESVPDYAFAMQIDYQEIAAYPGDFFNKVYKKLFEHYRYRPRVEPEDHIILGEE